MRPDSSALTITYNATGTKLRQATTFDFSTTTLTGNPIAAGTYSGQNISASGRVAIGTPVELTGTASVTLQDEFIVESGASFIAQVDSGRVNVGCAITSVHGILYPQFGP